MRSLCSSNLHLPHHHPAQTLTVPVPQMSCETCAALQHHACRKHSATANCWVEKKWAPSRCASCIRFAGLAYSGADERAMEKWSSYTTYFKQTESKKVSLAPFSCLLVAKLSVLTYKRGLAFSFPFNLFSLLSLSCDFILSPPQDGDKLWESANERRWFLSSLRKKLPKDVWSHRTMQKVCER